MQTITTRYVGPGNVRGSRMIARASGGLRVVLPYDDAAGSHENHTRAARALAELACWRGEFIAGALDASGALVWVPAESEPRFSR